MQGMVTIVDRLKELIKVKGFQVRCRRPVCLPGSNSARAPSGGWGGIGPQEPLTPSGWRAGGRQVAPAEVEASIQAHPGVADVAVIGAPDARAGEVVKVTHAPPRGGWLRGAARDRANARC